MKITKTWIPDLLVVEPKVFEDERGYFYEAYNQSVFEEYGLNFNFVQDNQSLSLKGVLRGLHYQLAPYDQAKLVRVLAGDIFDVAIDIRQGSPTFKQWYGLRLSALNKRQLLVPRGFAHGFVVLSEQAVVLYKCDNYYHKASERGINYHPEFSGIDINWPVDLERVVVSSKDNILPEFDRAEMNFHYGSLI